MVTISVTFKIRISNLLNCIAKPLHCSLYRVDQLLTQSIHTHIHVRAESKSIPSVHHWVTVLQLRVDHLDLVMYERPQYLEAPDV